MDIKMYEQLIIDELKNVVEEILNKNLRLNISAKARAGAEISDFLEEEFVKHTDGHRYFVDAKTAPKGATKNPWDAKVYFKYKSNIEEIWIDFKALKISSVDSNPDIGTPNKIVEFIRDGNFYLVYIYVYYQANDNGLEFVKHDGQFSKLYFLKDISPTFRRNPKNQLQVNMSEPPQYRSRENFIKLLFQKLRESHIRQIEISKRKLEKMQKEQDNIIKVNKSSEQQLLKRI